MNYSNQRTQQTKGNLQDKVYDMISDDHYHVGVRLHFKSPAFFQVLPEVGNVRIDHPLSTDQHRRIEPYLRSARDLQYE